MPWFPPCPFLWRVSNNPVTQVTLPIQLFVPSCHFEMTVYFSVNIPPEYLSPPMVITTPRATHLPPHGPWHCDVKILPGATHPQLHLYLLSKPESKAMEYVTEAGVH